MGTVTTAQQDGSTLAPEIPQRSTGGAAWVQMRPGVAGTGAVQLGASSGNVANAVAAATLAAAASVTTFISGFQVSGAGATAGLPVIVTVTGLLGGTQSFIYVAAAGALLPNQPLNVVFNPPMPASAVNTAIVVSCPALGAGNTHNCTSVQGFRL